jgi:hypothetical protein
MRRGGLRRFLAASKLHHKQRSKQKERKCFEHNHLITFAVLAGLRSNLLEPANLRKR